MIIITSTILAVIAIAAMFYIYKGMMRVQKEYLHILDQELDDLKTNLNNNLPELSKGGATFCVLNRRDMNLVFDEDWARKVGLPQAKWVIPEFRKMCNADSVDVFEKWIGQYVYLKDPVNRRLRFHLTFDGGKTYHWWELIYVLIEGASDAKIFPGLFINIDDVIAVENSIDQARNILYQTEMKQTYLASINHDLRTPINAIAGFASLLVKQYDDFSDEERKSFAELVESNSEILMQLLADFSDTNCNDIEKMKFKPRNKSVSDFINVVYQTNKIICPSHIKFNLEMDKSVGDKVICVDSKRMEQVINNFLSNSFKFTQVGFVTLGWKYLADTNEVELYVTDSGIGIKKENIDNLFTRFYKIHEHARGTGLGLNICKNIVEKQDGVIGVESTYGKGSTFYCRFKAV